VQTSQGNDRKKYVDQLLRLIRIFVTASRTNTAGPASKIVGPSSTMARQEGSEAEEGKFTTPQKPITRHYEAAAAGSFEVTRDFLFGEDTEGAAGPKEDSTEAAVARAEQGKEQPPMTGLQ